ncbi:unnamed protein product [Ilex paraguariensis]|uniref:TRAF-type domain-containing protein n=1 Tax=Ilex paraguariensis TaxID=185542 RepID=A0ABC8RLQ3_9AQUA
MDPPATDAEVKPETLEEIIEGAPLYHCDLFDIEIVHKIAEAFLPGLASACVDNTTGGLLKSPTSVAVDMRREMVQYLTQRSETFIAESVVLDSGPDAEVSDHPYDIVSDFIDDFAASKRNFFSRVSGWLLSERREDRIDDFVQEMEINGFWLIQRREGVAQTLLKNVDFKNAFHCNMKFNAAEELAEHIPHCSFRTINCPNEGCNARFSSVHLEYHDSICPLKILPCEQKCSDSIMRREMDKHCITICPMKLMNCPFYPVGCQSTIPQCTVEQHRLENLHSHLLYILQVVHKRASVEDLKLRVDQLEKSSSPQQLAEARDVRSLTFVIKNLEPKLGPLEVDTKKKASEPDKEEESTGSPARTEGCSVSPAKGEECSEPPTKEEECIESPHKTEECTKLPTKEEECVEIPSSKEECIEPLTKEEECTKSPSKIVVRDSPPIKEECTNSPSNPGKLMEVEI